MKKKVLITFLLLFISFNAKAEYIEYNNPTFDDINQYLLNSDIEPWYNPQLDYPIWVYKDYLNTWWPLATAQAFCSIKSEVFVNYIISNNKTSDESALYYDIPQTWWDHNKDIYKFTSIICDNWVITWTWWTTWTWSIVINNISENEWINKKVLNEATIIELYKYEAIIMVFIVLNTFFMRLIWRRPKPTWFF